MIAYTDGSTYKTNPGPMSWSVVYVENDKIVREEAGALYIGTNNKAELLGVTWALENNKTDDLIIRTDSTLTLNIVTGIWRAKTNLPEWERCKKALARRDLKGLGTVFQYVKGHSSDQYNRRADELAKEAATIAAKCLQETVYK